MSLFKSPPVDVGKTIQVVATINRQPFMVLVDAKSPHQTLADLTAAMKPKGDKASYATAAPFGTVVGEVYKLGTGVQAVEFIVQERDRFAQRSAQRRDRLRGARSGLRARASSARATCASWR